MTGAAAARITELSRCRAAHNLSEDDCQIWLGVGRATLERIEAGEVEPCLELAQRIDRLLNVIGGGLFPLTPATPGLACGMSASPTGAGGRTAAGASLAGQA